MAKLAINKKARFDYEILDTLEAGVILNGQEAKSVREGGLRLVESFVTFKGEEAFITNAHINRYSKASSHLEHDPTRPRKLLLHKKQIARLIGKKSVEGLTIVPLCAYIKGGKIKIEIGIARGKKKHDKRAVLKKRDTDREIRRALKKNL